MPAPIDSNVAEAGLPADRSALQDILNRLQQKQEECASNVKKYRKDVRKAKQAKTTEASAGPRSLAAETSQQIEADKNTNAVDVEIKSRPEQPMEPFCQADATKPGAVDVVAEAISACAEDLQIEEQIEALQQDLEGQQLATSSSVFSKTDEDRDRRDRRLSTLTDRRLSTLTFHTAQNSPRLSLPPSLPGEPSSAQFVTPVGSVGTLSVPGSASVSPSGSPRNRPRVSTGSVACVAQPPLASQCQVDFGAGDNVTDHTQRSSVEDGAAVASAGDQEGEQNPAAVANIKGTGKGKGGKAGKGPKAPPPPKAPPGDGKGKGKDKNGKDKKAQPTSNMVCVHWKVSSQPEDSAQYGDAYLTKTLQHGSELFVDGDLMRREVYADAEALAISLQEGGDEWVCVQPNGEEVARVPLETAYDEICDRVTLNLQCCAERELVLMRSAEIVHRAHASQLNQQGSIAPHVNLVGHSEIFEPHPPPSQPPAAEFLEHYFEKSQVRPFAKQAEADQKDGKSSMPLVFLDDTRLQMLGVMMKKFLMRHKGDGTSPCECENCAAMLPAATRLSAIIPSVKLQQLQAILSIKRGVLRCDFDILKLEALSILRSVVKNQEKVTAIREMVNEHGEGAIGKLNHPEMHCLVYELSKIPQIDARLECMIFNITFEEAFTTCKRNLETHTKALQLLLRKREHIRRFFMTAHRLGQSLNRRASQHLQAPRGFQLSTLDKLKQTKSSKSPNLSILHFVLALLDQEHANELFNADDIAILQSASILKTDTVIQDARQLTRALYDVHEIFGETGKYTCPVTGEAIAIKKRRKSTVPAGGASPDVFDTDDKFHEVMQAFVNDYLEQAEDIAEWAWHNGLQYKELALFFDDVQSVHPPPRGEQAKDKEDLLDIFHRFAGAIRSHRDDVERENLREIIVRSATAQCDDRPADVAPLVSPIPAC